MKKIFILLFLLLSLMTYSKDKINVGVVLSSGGLGTGFNQMAYDGLKKAEGEGLINFKYVEPSNITEDLEFLRPKVRGSFDPYEIYKLKNKVLKHDLNKGEAVLKKNIK